MNREIKFRVWDRKKKQIKEIKTYNQRLEEYNKPFRFKLNKCKKIIEKNLI